MPPPPAGLSGRQGCSCRDQGWAGRGARPAARTRHYRAWDGSLSPAAAQTEFSFPQLRLPTGSTLNVGLIRGLLLRRSLIFSSSCWLPSMEESGCVLRGGCGGPGAFPVCLDIETRRFGVADCHKQSCALFSFPSVFPFILSFFFLFPFLSPARPWTRHSGFRNDSVEILALRKIPV